MTEKKDKEPGLYPGAKVVIPPEVHTAKVVIPPEANPETEANAEEMTEAQLTAEVRAIEKHALAMMHVHRGLTAFLQLKAHVATLNGKKIELEGKIADHEKLLAKSFDLQVAAVQRYEKERVQKEADERARFEQTKKEIQEEGQKLTLDLSDLKQRETAAKKRAEDAEKLADKTMTDLEDVLAQHKQEVDQKIERFDQQLAAKKAEYDAVDGKLKELLAQLQGGAAVMKPQGEAGAPQEIATGGG